MTTNVLSLELKKITTDWFQRHEAEIAKGSTVDSPSELLAYERRLFLLLVQLGALIIALVLKTRIADKEFQDIAAERIVPKNSKRYRNQAYLWTTITTSFGNTVRLKTRYYRLRRSRGRKRRWGKRGKNGSGIYPTLELLGIRDGVTPALAADIAREVTEGPSMEAVQERFARLGLAFDIKLIQRISEAFAEIGLLLRNTWAATGGKIATPLILDGETLEGKRVMLGTDGGRIRIRKSKRGRKPKGGRSGFWSDWREPKLLVIRIIDDTGKVVRELPPIYDGTLGNADALFSLFEAHLRARHIELASEIICMSDGSKWIWDRMGSMLEGLGVDPAKVSFGVDYYHAVEHLAKVAEERRGWTQKHRRHWLNKMKALLKMGKVDVVIEELWKLARGRNAPSIVCEIGYFEGHKERMRYDILQERNLPIGSGTVESAIRQVVNMRLKSTGMFWLEENAEAFLHLRCFLKSGRWAVVEKAIIEYQVVRS